MFNFNSLNPGPIMWATALILAATPIIALVYLASGGGADRAEDRVNFQRVSIGVWSVNIKKGEFIECLINAPDPEPRLVYGDIGGLDGREYISIRGDSHTADTENGVELKYWGYTGSLYDCVLFADVYDWTQNRRYEKTY